MAGDKFLTQGFPLNNSETLTKLQATCKYVYIDELKSKTIISNHKKKALDVKGIIIGADDDLRIKRALSVTTNIEFFKYEVKFKLFN